MFLAHQLSIIRHLACVEVDAISRYVVGISFGLEFLYHGDLLWDVLGSAWSDIKWINEKIFAVLVKERLILFGNISSRKTLSTSSFLHFVFSMIRVSLVFSCEVSDIGNVHYVRSGVAENVFDGVFE